MAKRGKRNRKITAGSNGMQKVVNWNLQDAIPILSGPTPINPDIPVRVEFAAGVNRWSYTVTQGGTSHSIESEYGETTGQFTELAELWSTYSHKNLSLEMTPNMQGSGVQSVVITAIDTAGNQDLNSALPWEDQLVVFSRLRSFKSHPSLGKPIRVNCDYNKWLKDTVP